jgi:hypothetical protein
MFMVSWACHCCKDGQRQADQSWFYMHDLVNNFGQDADRLRHLETIAIRELREKETKKHAKELTKYLSFEDVDDFMQESEFVEKNFST